MLFFFFKIFCHLKLTELEFLKVLGSCSQSKLSTQEWKIGCPSMSAQIFLVSIYGVSDAFFMFFLNILD